MTVGRTIQTHGPVSILGDPRNPGTVKIPVSVAKALGLVVAARSPTRPEQLDEAFAAASAEGDQAMIVQFSALTFEERWRVVGFADRFRMPHLDGVDAPRRHRCAKVVVLNNHHRGGVHGPG